MLHKHSETGSGLRDVLRLGCVVTFQIKCNHVGFSFYICRYIVTVISLLTRGWPHYTECTIHFTSQCWRTLHFLLQHMFWKVSTQMQSPILQFPKLKNNCMIFHCIILFFVCVCVKYFKEITFWQLNGSNILTNFTIRLYIDSFGCISGTVWQSLLKGKKILL